VTNFYSENVVRLTLFPSLTLTSTLAGHSASEVTTIRRYTNMCIIVLTGANYIKYVAKAVLGEWPSNTSKVIAIAAITYVAYHFLLVTCCKNILISHCYKILLFQCMWHLVTLRSPSLLTIKLKSQAMCAFGFTPISRVVDITRISNNKSDLQSNTRSLELTTHAKKIETACGLIMPTWETIYHLDTNMPYGKPEYKIWSI